MVHLHSTRSRDPPLPCHILAATLLFHLESRSIALPLPLRGYHPLHLLQRQIHHHDRPNQGDFHLAQILLEYPHLRYHRKFA